MDSPSRCARMRWNILATAVLGQFNYAATNKEHKVADLLCDKLFKTSKLVTCENGDSNEVNSKCSDWVELTPYDPQQNQTNADESRLLHLKIDRTMCWSGDRLKERLRILTGFDNTGNVRLWPSELLLAHLFLVPHLYSSVWTHLAGSVKRVCELGAGMSGAVGLSVSLSSLKPDYVLLSDGNDRCVDTLLEVAGHHMTHQTTNTEVVVTKLVWPAQPSEQLSIPDGFRHSFQLVVAADCFFQTNCHQGLLRTIDQLLECDHPASFIALAPLRGKTLLQFIDAAQATGTWAITCMPPNEYISSSLLSYLLDGLPVEQKTIWDETLGHLLVLERKIKY